ncbi:hypothetical protein C8Q78DRAFT_398497 [Trametes maxima]|nr:hypothetical protein C8Q78DRAFT_398497 [Trametes maxima]
MRHRAYPQLFQTARSQDTNPTSLHMENIEGNLVFLHEAPPLRRLIRYRQASPMTGVAAAGDSLTHWFSCMAQPLLVPLVVPVVACAVLLTLGLGPRGRKSTNTKEPRTVPHSKTTLGKWFRMSNFPFHSSMYVITINRFAANFQPPGGRARREYRCRACARATVDTLLSRAFQQGPQTSNYAEFVLYVTLTSGCATYDSPHVTRGIRRAWPSVFGGARVSTVTNPYLLQQYYRPK